MATGAFLVVPGQTSQPRVVSARILVPWRGAWVADLDVDPDDVVFLPATGSKVTLKIGDSTFLGTVDARWSGPFVASGKVRLLAGGGGWDHLVTPKHYHADNGVTTTTVYADAAMSVGETVVEQTPGTLGIDFVRAAGPASQVFSRVNWWVDFKGVTQVGKRAPTIPDVSFELLSWDPAQKAGIVSSDVPIVPGTTFTDKRIGTSVTVRDVEHQFDASGTRATIWVADAATTRLAGVLANMVHELGELRALRCYRYRIVSQAGDGRLSLQAVNPSAGIPDSVAISPFYGAQGLRDKIDPGKSGEVAVTFLDGDLSQPRVVAFQNATPLEETVDASVKTHVGPSSALVEIAGGSDFLVKALPYASLLTALAAFASACSSSTDATLAAAASALTTALGALPVPATLKTKAT